MSETRVQSPAIGNALRAALDLDAAGPMGLTSDTNIVPVAVVADVRELLTSKFIPVQQSGQATAVAGEFGYSMLEWQTGSLPRPGKIILDSIIFSTVSAAQVFLGFTTSGFPGTLSGLPRRKVGSLQSSAIAGRVVNGTSVNDPTIVIDRFSGRVDIPAATSYELLFREPIILDREGQMFAIGCGTVNVTLRAYFQWREERT